MLITKVLSGLTFIGSVVWFIAQPDYEPAIAILTSLTAFIGAWFVDQKQKRKVNQNQSISKNGIGIQAGGDVSLGCIRTSEKDKDAE